MLTRLAESVGRWCDARGIDQARRPSHRELLCINNRWGDPTLPGVAPAEIDAWEGRHGFQLPEGLKLWLSLSNGFKLAGPVIHPLGGIGPMVPFARMPEVVVQPESWFELGNPNLETVCVDLGYRWDGVDFPLFTSGDDEAGTRPRIIARGFDSWFLQLLREGGREFWFDPDALNLGDPWVEHLRHVPPPYLSDELRALAPQVEQLLLEQRDERTIAQRLGVTRFDVEAISRYLQHQQTTDE